MNERRIAGWERIVYLGGVVSNADVAELADAQVLGACGEIRVGSSPSVRILSEYDETVAEAGHTKTCTDRNAVHQLLHSTMGRAFKVLVQRKA